LRARTALAAAGLVLAVAGCGGGDSLSAKDLRTGAGSICAAARAQTNRIAAPSSPAGAALFLTRGVAVLRSERPQLQTLRPPDELGHTWSNAMDAFSQRLAAVSATVRDLARGGDPVTAMKALQHKLTPIEAREDDAWQHLEVPACVNQ
jgi:hypothetical protein